MWAIAQVPRIVGSRRMGPAGQVDGRGDPVSVGTRAKYLCVGLSIFPAKLRAPGCKTQGDCAWSNAEARSTDTPKVINRLKNLLAISFHFFLKYATANLVSFVLRSHCGRGDALLCKVLV